jgi:hypothetical protein
MKTININGKEYNKDEFNLLIKNWKVNKLFENIAIIPPEPPTLRPMSELPDGNANTVVLFDSGKTGHYWEDASSHYWGVELDKGGIFRKSDNYVNCYKERLLGWMPSIELPNPNEIKLPC